MNAFRFGFTASIVLTAACACVAPHAGAAGPAAQPLRSSSGANAIPKRFVDELTSFAEPGPRHRGFEWFVGHWTTKTRVWADPDAKPAEFDGSAEYRVILGGRFLFLDSQAKVGDVVGHGLGIYGYDNFKQRYSFYYIHDGDTQALNGLGQVDSLGTQIRFDMTMDMPTSGESAKPIHAILLQAGADRHVFEMYETSGDGREWKVLEITYERGK